MDGRRAVAARHPAAARVWADNTGIRVLRSLRLFQGCHPQEETVHAIYSRVLRRFCGYTSPASAHTAPVRTPLPVPGTVRCRIETAAQGTSLVVVSHYVRVDYCPICRPRGHGAVPA